MMQFLLLLLYITHTESVILFQEDKRVILKDGRNPCEGYVQIYQNNAWGYIGDKYWNMSTEKVVCRSTHCGEPVKGSTEDVEKPTDDINWLNEVKCSGDESQLWDCKICGWNTSIYLKDTVKKIKCSHTIKISLDGFQCAGAVQYSTNGNTPSGYICADNWGQSEANYLCNKLSCGDMKKIPQQPWMLWEKFQTSKKMAIQCSDIKNVEKDLWHCVTQESPQCQTPASVICEGHERLQIRGNASNVCFGQLEIEKGGKWEPALNITGSDTWCQQMYCGSNDYHINLNNSIELKCSDTVNVVLMDNNKPSRCYGAVHIKVSNSTYPVCASNWNEKAGELVCKELNCGKLISNEEKKGIVQGIMDYVDCSGSESSLWHCQAKHHKIPFSCSSKAYVVCGGSVSVKLMDGPGKCAGRVEILHEGAWKQVSKSDWTERNSDTVCKQLGCGKKRNTTKVEKFFKGSGNFFVKKVNCEEKASDISECITQDSNIKEMDPVGITCTEHKLVFLDGNTACSGKVGIEHGKQTYWLSGSKETWNNDTATVVCRQMHCGDAQNFTSIKNADGNEMISAASPCAPESKSLLDCLKPGTLSSDPNGTIASVTCSGNITINLSEKCRGTVKVCINNKCGGVSKDTWTNDQSEMLCKNLKCGKKALPAINPPKNKVTIKSVHSAMQTTKLIQSTFLKCDEPDNMCDTNSAYVVCSGCVKPQLTTSRHKCIGNVKLSYDNELLPVCKDALKDKETQTIICKELNCGNAINEIDYFGYKPKSYPAISTLQCPKKSNGSLKDCNITRSDNNNCDLVGLQCSEWRKMKLSDTCSGGVFVHSDGKKSPVSNDGWTKTEGTRLCQDLGCGSQIKLHNTSGKGPLWNRGFSCADVQDKTNIWDCEKKTTPTQKQQLVIECEDVPVTLSKKCAGIVKINDTEVCSTGWDDIYSHLVCQEQDCSNAVVKVDMTDSPKENKEYYHVRCDKGQHKLGQCDRIKAKCEGKLVSVYCVANVMFNISQKCGGEIKVKYQNAWENVCAVNMGKNHKDMLCQKLGCSAFKSDTSKTNTRSSSTRELKTALDCTNNIMDIRHCVRAKSCKAKPAEIYCEEYVEPPTTDPPTTIPTMSILLGIGCFLVLVILIVVFVRIFMAKRARNTMKLQSRMLSQNDVEFESGDYEDVKASEMEDFSRGRFRSEGEAIMDHDGRSISSFHYDDVDEAVESQPLTSQTSTTGASGDNKLHEDTPDESHDIVTYEVEDPQEGYDDIETTPEITQTKAEVHNSHQTTPEGDTVPPPELVQGDDDYLVPDQNG